MSSSYVKCGTTVTGWAICLRSQTHGHAWMLTHIITHNMQKCLLPASVSVRVCGCVFVCARHVYLNINPAGTTFKCQTFNLLNLTLGDIQAWQSPTTTWQDIGVKKKCKDPKILYQRSIPLSAVEQIEVSCGERRESVPIQVVNRRWRLRGGWGGEREVKWERQEGFYSRYIMNEVRCHIFDVELYSLYSAVCCSPLTHTFVQTHFSYYARSMLANFTLYKSSIDLKINLTNLP